MSAQRPESTPRRQFRHTGACGVREFCWRPSCRREFGDYRTIERWPSTGLVIARCHRMAFDVPGWHPGSVVDGDTARPHLRAVA